MGRLFRFQANGLAASGAARERSGGMTRALNPVFASRPVTIFAVMSALARQHGAVNLGQGFPDEDGPPALKEIAARAILEEPNQYAPVGGLPALRAALASANKRFYGLDIDAETETLVTAGATEALAACFMAFLQPADEAVLFAPAYDCYAPIVEAAGAAAKIVRLEPPYWRIERAQVESALSPLTRVIAINTPHNPTGRVLSREELQVIADIAVERDLLVICDEVYEHLVFDGAPHLPLMAFPGMRARTVRIGSAGKTFSMTGWRIGYAGGPAELIKAIGVMQSQSTSNPSSISQAASVAALNGDQSFLKERNDAFKDRRDTVVKMLNEADGIECLTPEGAFYVYPSCAGCIGKKTPDGKTIETDSDFVTYLLEAEGVACVQGEAFGLSPYFRISYATSMDSLKEACRRIQRACKALQGKAKAA
ncbi:MAG TPA: aspartate transaminase [Parvularcula sp.]|nr:aspartate transaminase [Parvularcula sp.]